MKFLLNIIKNGGIKGAIKGEAKKWLIIILSIFLAIILVISALEALKNSFLCNSVIKISCPKPPVDMERVNDLSKDLEKERYDIWKGLDDQDANQKFRTLKEIGAEEGGDEDEKFNEAEYYIRTMAAIDFKTYLEYVRTNDLKKDQPLDNSPIDYSLKYAKEDFDDTWTNLFRTKKAEAKKFAKNKTHYIMNWRIKVYECFLLGDHEVIGNACEDKILKSMGTKDFQGVATSKSGDDFKNQRIKQILEDFYEISFIKYLDGKVPGVPEGKSREMFDEMLAEQMQGYNELYPPQLPPATPFSVGWLIPMVEGTYNFSSEFGPRWGKLHQGVDMGTATVNAVPYFAAKGGTVVSAGWNDGGYGGVVTIDHGDGFYSTYNHMNPDNIVVRKGQTVSQGQLIGGAGGEPNLAIHLHFEICISLKDSSGYDLSGGGMKICSERINPEREDLYGSSIRTPKQDMALTREYANKFLKEWKAKAKSGEAIIMPGFTPTGGLGELSKAYEGNPAVCNPAPENRNNLACGAWQLTDTSIGGFLDFLKSHKPEYYEQFKGLHYLDYNTTFVNAWSRVYESDPNGFFQAQHGYIAQSHFVPIVEIIKEDYGFDVMTAHRAVQEMIWSASVQHRYNTPKKIWGPAIGKNWEGKSDAQLINLFYDQRKWQYDPCCGKRFDNERNDALAMLASSPKKEKE